MSKYMCVLCNYTTIESNKYKKHTQTKKHLKNMEQIIRLTEYPHIQKQLDSIVKLVNLLPKNKYFRICNEIDNLIACANDVICDDIENMGFVNFLNLNYPDALDLKPISPIIVKLILKCINSKSFVIIIIEKHEKQLIVKYIGDMIIKYYKKDDTDTQSFWCSNVDKLTYVIKHIDEKTGVSKWIDDKSGTNIKKCILKPIIDFIIDIAYKSNNLCSSCNDLINYLLHTSTIQSDILNYMASSFCLIK
jgi:hypothetical protein